MRPYRGSPIRPRLRSGVFFGGLALAFALSAPGRAVAQEPPDSTRAAADTVAIDTLAVPVPGADSIPPDSAAAAQADSLRPAPRLAEFSDPVRVGWGAGVWVWDREALMASGAVALTDLLEQVPGLIPIRSGFFGMPQTASALGLTGGRIQLVLDGFALDPLRAATFDLSRLELVHLGSVRVERRAGVLRVEIETLVPEDPRPYTLIEAGKGEPLSTDLLRGLFLAPRVLGGPLGVAIERLDTDGVGRAEPASTFTGWLKWGRVSDAGNGVTLELRRSSIERGGTSPVPGTGSRNDLIVRARTQPLPGLVAEAYVGRSTLEDQLGADTLSSESLQTGVRVGYQEAGLWSRAAVRFRLRTDPSFGLHRQLPGAEAELATGLQFSDALRVAGDLNWSLWRGESAASLGIRTELRPFPGLLLFGEADTGERGVPFLTADDAAPAFTRRDAFRAGAELAWGDLFLGGAGLLLDTDSVAAFGLPFVSGPTAGGLFRGGRVRGWEMSARIPLLWDPLSLEGWYTVWIDGSPWIYLPTECWRAALVYHHLPMASGNLEITARLEGRHRGPMRVPLLGAGSTTSIVNPLTSLDFYLQIRILSVRAFVRWENLLSRDDLVDIPGRALPGQRLLYGVKWEFWN